MQLQHLYKTYNIQITKSYFPEKFIFAIYFTEIVQLMNVQLVRKLMYLKLRRAVNNMKTTEKEPNRPGIKN